ncbi:MAG: cation-translocating P-type ATPase [Holophagales bacterium]|nr:cation-translocating P-type ATPase [Holophagales bacterium]
MPGSFRSTSPRSSSGADWGRHGWEELVHCREVGIEALMAAAAIGAAALGLWDEAAALVFLYGLAESVEHLTYDRAKRAIERLLDLVPAQASVLRDGTETIVEAARLQRGDRIRVRPGESIPTDGVVEEGSSAVDESSLTGEPIPIEKKPGERLFAGTLNRTGSLVFRATAAADENSVSRLVKLVETAQKSKGPEPAARRALHQHLLSPRPRSRGAPSPRPHRNRRELLRVGAIRRRPPRRGGSLRSRDVDARGIRGRNVCRRSPRHPDQGRPVPRGARPGPDRCLRQDRDAHARAAGARRRGARGGHDGLGAALEGNLHRGAL